MDVKNIRSNLIRRQISLSFTANLICNQKSKRNTNNKFHLLQDAVEIDNWSIIDPLKQK